MTINRIHAPVNRYVERANHAREQKSLSQHVLNIKKITDPIINSSSSIEASRGASLAATVMEQTRKEIFSGPLDSLIEQIKPFLNTTVANSMGWETVLTINSMLKDISSPTEREFTNFSEEAGLLFNTKLKDVSKLEKKTRDILSNFLVKLTDADAKNDDKALAKALRKFNETTNTEVLNRIGDRLLERVKLLPEKEFRVETLFGEAIVHLEYAFGGKIEETDKITQEFQERLNRFSRDDAVSETKYRQEILSMIDAFESLMGINRSKVGDDVQQALRKGAQQPDDNSGSTSNLDTSDAADAANGASASNQEPAPLSNDPQLQPPSSSVVLTPKPAPEPPAAPTSEPLPPMSSPESDSPSASSPFSLSEEQTSALESNDADDDEVSRLMSGENFIPIDVPSSPVRSSSPRLYPDGERVHTTGSLTTTVVQPGQGRRSPISAFEGIDPNKFGKTKGNIPVQSYLELLKSRDEKLDMAARSHKTPLSADNAKKTKAATPASFSFLTPSARKKTDKVDAAASPTPEDNTDTIDAVTSAPKPESVTSSEISFEPRAKVTVTDQHPPLVFVKKMEEYVSDPEPADAPATNHAPEAEVSSSNSKPYVTRFIRGVESVKDENGKWTDVAKTVKDQLKTPVKVGDEKWSAPQEQDGEPLGKIPSPVWDRRAAMTPDVKGYRTPSLSTVAIQPGGRSGLKSPAMEHTFLNKVAPTGMSTTNPTAGVASSDRAKLPESNPSSPSRASSPTPNEQDVTRSSNIEESPSQAESKVDVSSASTSASSSTFRVKTWDPVAPPHLVRSPKLLTKEVKTQGDRSSPTIQKKV